jgi:hypothetical protein
MTTLQIVYEIFTKKLQSSHSKNIILSYNHNSTIDY